MSELRDKTDTNYCYLLMNRTSPAMHAITEQNQMNSETKYILDYL